MHFVRREIWPSAVKKKISTIVEFLSRAVLLLVLLLFQRRIHLSTSSNQRFPTCSHILETKKHLCLASGPYTAINIQFCAQTLAEAIGRYGPFSRQRHSLQHARAWARSARLLHEISFFIPKAVCFGRGWGGGGTKECAKSNEMFGFVEAMS